MFLSHLSRKAFKGLLKHGAIFAKPRSLHSDVSCLRIISVNPGTTISVNKYVLSNIEFKRWINTSQASLKKEIVTVNFIKPNGEKITTQGKEGDSLLDVVVDRNIDIDGFGACEGTLACSTCHLIFNEEVFQKMKDKPSDEEMDMLDLAYGLTDTSRLGCQVFLTKELDGMEIKVPDTINDARQ